MTATFIILAILAGLLGAALARLVLDISGDGYGHRPAPRSLADEAEPAWVQLARLS